MLPKISGLEVCQCVKTDPELFTTVVILLTAKGQQVDRQIELAMGADYYMTKPFRPKQLLSKAKRILGLE